MKSLEIRSLVHETRMEVRAVLDDPSLADFATGASIWVPLDIDAEDPAMLCLAATGPDSDLLEYDAVPSGPVNVGSRVPPFKSFVGEAIASRALKNPPI